MIIKLLRAWAEDTEVFTEGGDCMKLVMLFVSVEQCLWEGNEATQEHCRLVTQRTFVTRVTTPPSPQQPAISSSAPHTFPGQNSSSSSQIVLTFPVGCWCWWTLLIVMNPSRLNIFFYDPSPVPPMSTQRGVKLWSEWAHTSSEMSLHHSNDCGSTACG